MKRATLVSLLCASLCFFAASAFAQTISAVVQQQPAASAKSSFTCRATFSPAQAMILPVPTAPYSALQESSNVQTLADGTHIAHKPMTEKFYRDSQGRTRTERSFCQGPGGTTEALVVEIRDPVAGYSYILDEQNQVAHRFLLQLRHLGNSALRTTNDGVPAAMAAPVTPRQDASMRNVTTESLGTQTMEGVLVEGTRTTLTFPEGSQDNDRPITVVNDVWRSPELKINVLVKTDDPRSGESTIRLTNIDLSNPILSLFQPPPDCKIVDETDRVTLTYTRP
jgi:hypothetical protein